MRRTSERAEERARVDRSRALARGGCFIHYWAGGRHSSMAITKMADDEMMSDEAEGRDDRLISSYWASRRVDL